jgi:hypothetical protein
MYTRYGLWKHPFSHTPKRSKELQKDVFQITFGGWQNVGTVVRKYPTNWSFGTRYKFENPYYSQKMFQFPTVGSTTKLQTLWCGFRFCARTPLQLGFDTVTDHWLWYKQKLKAFIGNWLTQVSDIPENVVLVCKVAGKPSSIHWNRIQLTL